MMSADNLLISNFDTRTHVDGYGDFVSVVHIQERYSYTPVDGGYQETVVVQGDREKLRLAAGRALEYARGRGLRVQVNNPHVLADIRAGALDASGVVIVGVEELGAGDD